MGTGVACQKIKDPKLSRKIIKDLFAITLDPPGIKLTTIETKRNAGTKGPGRIFTNVIVGGSMITLNRPFFDCIENL